MNCLICGKIFYKKRTLKTLFKDDINFICPSCEKKHFLFLQTQVIPKTGGVFKITSFFTEDNNIKLEVFYKEIKTWLINSITTNKDNYLIWVDKLNLDLLKLFELANGNVHILTNKIFEI